MSSLKLYKKIVCFGIIVAFILAETGGITYASSKSGFEYYPNLTDLKCSRKQLTVEGYIQAKGEQGSAGVEIYRANIKKNGKKGKFKKIGKQVTLNQSEDYWHKDRWNFTYADYTVKTGQAYAYKCRAYGITGNNKRVQSGYSSVKKGVAARTVGQYTCKVLKNTKKKFIVKLTGVYKDNGPLEIIGYGKDAQLRYKNKGEDEVDRVVYLKRFSYDNKKWYKYRQSAWKKGSFVIKGKKSVYLEFWHKNWLENIKFINYQYAQMFIIPVKYNLRYKHPLQIRFNFTSGKALVDDFWISDEYSTPSLVWDNDIFQRIFAE